jgi:hypothetical protein
MTWSYPVAIANDQSAVPVGQTGSWVVGQTGDWTVGVSGTVPVSGTFWQENQPVTAGQTGIWNITNITGTVSLPTGAATETSLSKLTILQGATLGSNTQTLVGASVSIGEPGYTAGQISPLSLTTTGRLRVDSSISSGRMPTYSVSSTATIAATPTDVFTIYGSANKVIKILHLSFKATAQQNGFYNVYAIKRSTANTGGTSSVETAVPLDSADAAATATVRTYTANPTALGTAVGTVSIDRVLITNTSTTPSQDDSIIFADGYDSGKCITLRGTNEGLCVNLNSVSVTGNAFVFHIMWTEE